ncbi:hypothetical protein NEMBOFW57_006194 [Staphylotrichum longicolle]|uniref:Uncharacterized protein n=1 Tax=Staphylotrichum longicolle TaxID=669026 RepID=A0AAD4HZ84_9PEZI|nr:hypothetical protein NEMBOFW57_006194 [Staphylotrichum longicolle]
MALTTFRITEMLRNHHDVALACLMVRSRTHTHVAASGIGNIRKIADLAVSQVYLNIDQEQFARDGAEDKRISNGAANLAGADNRDSSGWIGVLGGHFSTQLSLPPPGKMGDYKKEDGDYKSMIRRRLGDVIIVCGDVLGTLVG